MRASSLDFIRKRLEKALDSLRTTRGALNETGGGKGGSGAPLLGKKGEAFTFAQCGSKVLIEATSVEGEPGLGAVQVFLQQHAR